MSFRRIGRMTSALLVSTVLMGSAYGADLAYKAAPIMAPVPMVTWTGLSVFGFVGWGQLNGNTDYTGTDANSQAFLAAVNKALGIPLSYGSNTSGLVGGGGGEYDYQLGPSGIILGARADYTYFGQTSSSVASGALNRRTTLNVTNNIGLVGIATVRGVLAWSPPSIPNAEIYANVGPAFGQVTQETIVGTSPASPFFGIDQPFTGNTWGWVVGLGARYLLTANWYLQVEGNFFDLTNVASNNSFQGVGWRQTTGVTAKTATFGIGYKF